MITNTHAFFEGPFFLGGFFSDVEAGLGNLDWLRGGRAKKKKKKPRVLYWHDYANAEERTVALAKALAEASTPLEAISSEDDAIIEDEDDLIISMVMSRMIGTIPAEYDTAAEDEDDLIISMVMSRLIH